MRRETALDFVAGANFEAELERRRIELPIASDALAEHHRDVEGFARFAGWSDMIQTMFGRSAAATGQANGVLQPRASNKIAAGRKPSGRFALVKFKRQELRCRLDVMRA